MFSGYGERPFRATVSFLSTPSSGHVPFKANSIRGNSQLANASKWIIQFLAPTPDVTYRSEKYAGISWAVVSYISFFTHLCSLLILRACMRALVWTRIYCHEVYGWWKMNLSRIGTKRDIECRCHLRICNGDFTCCLKQMKK